jgi:hypothetical protein
MTVGGGLENEKHATSGSLARLCEYAVVGREQTSAFWPTAGIFPIFLSCADFFLPPTGSLSSVSVSQLHMKVCVSSFVS